jgi:hypothetical protein
VLESKDPKEPRARYGVTRRVSFRFWSARPSFPVAGPLCPIHHGFGLGLARQRRSETGRDFLERFTHRAQHRLQYVRRGSGRNVMAASEIKSRSRVCATVFRESQLKRTPRSFPSILTKGYLVSGAGCFPRKPAHVGSKRSCFLSET